jgi:hypothetical protein
MAPLTYRGHRFPPEIIQHAIWLYLRFTLSYRDVEELLAERPRRRGPRHAGAAPPRQPGGVAADAQAPQEAGFAPKLLVTDKLHSCGSAFRPVRRRCRALDLVQDASDR